MATLREANTPKVLPKLKIRRYKPVMEHPKEPLLTEFKLLHPLEDITFRHKIRLRGKLFKRHILLVQPLMLSKDLLLKEVLMATRQGNKMLHRHHHRQMRPIKQLTVLIKLITALLSITTEKLTKPRRPTTHNSRPRMCKVDKAPTTLRTQLGQPKPLIQRLEQMFIRLL